MKLRDRLAEMELQTIARGNLLINDQLSIPYTLIKGAVATPIIGVSAGVHGCEAVGINVSFLLPEVIDLKRLQGSLVILHTVNPSGATLVQRLVPEDGVDLNRIFQDKTDKNTVAYQIKSIVEREFFSAVDVVIDLHGGSDGELLTPHAYYSLHSSTEVVETSRKMAIASGTPILYASSASGGLYQAASNDFHLPSIILEYGENGTCSIGDAQALLEQTMRVIRFICEREIVSEQLTKHYIEFNRSYTIQAPASGFWYSRIKAGTWVQKGQLLGIIRNTHGEVIAQVISEVDGMVLYFKAALPIEKQQALVTIANYQEGI